MSPSLKRKIKKIIPFGLLWAYFGLMYVLLEKGILGDSSVYPSTQNVYNFGSAVVGIPIGSLIMGLVFGIIEVFLIQKLFQLKTFLQKIIFKTLFYIILLCVLIITQSLIVNSFVLGLPITDPKVIESISVFFTSFAFVSVIFYAGSIIAIMMFIFEVSDNLGLHVVNNFITGRYHKPREENRIFMFLDMKSSTTIAEKIGHVKYFELLTKYYQDISKIIVRTSGEVYQYVGDEIIVSWSPKKGARNNNCLRCFFQTKEEFKRLSEKYIEDFNLVPDFKAGIHYGKVTTGEIGTIKKEIVFTGDVLNTTSRIQNLCKQYGVDLLVSKDLIEMLDMTNEFEVNPIGEQELRGKNGKVQLFSINPPQ